MNKDTIAAAAICRKGDCKFEVACSEPDTALAFVNAAFVRHQLEAHGIKVAQP